MKYHYHYFLIFILLTLFSCAKSTDSEPIERVQYHMGTYARIQVDDGTIEDIEAGFNKIKELDSLLSDYSPESEISEINNMAGVRAVKVDSQVIQVLELAKGVASETSGAFDPTVGALTIGVYRFGREDNKEIDLKSIDRAKSLVNYRELLINKDSVYLEKKGMMIDLGGIGKGYAVEQAADVLNQLGVRSGMVAISGDIKVFGQSVNIAIKNPSEEGNIASFTNSEEETSISTSGGYERYQDIEGKVYHHLIVPKTGKPGADFLSLTVVMSGDSALADAYATALFVMGKEKALGFINSRDDLGVFIVYPDSSIFYNETFSSLVNNLRVND